MLPDLVSMRCGILLRSDADALGVSVGNERDYRSGIAVEHRSGVRRMDNFPTFSHALLRVQLLGAHQGKRVHPDFSAGVAEQCVRE